MFKSPCVHHSISNFFSTLDSTFSRQNLKIPAMKKLVVELELLDQKSKRKAMRTVSDIDGVESIQIDLKNKKLIIIGDADPVGLVNKLRKVCSTTMISFGPTKEEKKKEESMKPDKKGAMADHLKTYQAYNYPYTTPYY